MKLNDALFAVCWGLFISLLTFGVGRMTLHPFERIFLCVAIAVIAACGVYAYGDNKE